MVGGRGIGATALDVVTGEEVGVEVVEDVEGVGAVVGDRLIDRSLLNFRQSWTENSNRWRPNNYVNDERT